MIRNFIPVHDDFLGRLDIQSITEYSHPFQMAPRREDQFDTVEKKGWLVIDVSGDGHCGYYSFFLGLRNVGKDDYFVDTQNVSQRIGTG